MREKVIVFIGLSPVFHKEIIDGHIFTMQQRSLHKLFVKIGNDNLQKENCSGVGMFCLRH